MLYYIENEKEEVIFKTESFNAAHIKGVIGNWLKFNPTETLYYYRGKDEDDKKYVGDHLLGVYENRQGRPARILSRGYKYLT
jgi:hypothetical protein